MIRRDHRDLAIEQFANEAIDVESLAADFLRDAKTYREMALMAWGAFAAERQEAQRLRAKNISLREELTRFTAAAVGGGAW